METATFAAGCFWGPELTFGKVPGVTSTSVGYIGGHVDNPDYRDVCTGTSNHAEAVQVEFDPSVVSYAQLLEVFWASHDPTQLNRQGPDVGTQYRSAIFCHTEDQLAAAQAAKVTLGDAVDAGRPITTTVEMAPTFWTAEEHHQKFLEKRGATTCHM